MHNNYTNVYFDLIHFATGALSWLFYIKTRKYTLKQVDFYLLIFKAQIKSQTNLILEHKIRSLIKCI